MTKDEWIADTYNKIKAHDDLVRALGLKYIMKMVEAAAEEHEQDFRDGVLSKLPWQEDSN